jgi:hypothetical protein
MNPAVIEKEVVLETRILIGCCDSPTQPCASWHTCSCNLEISKNINLEGRLLYWPQSPRLALDLSSGESLFTLTGAEALT